MLLGGKTRLVGNAVNNVASIAYPLEEKNVFILAYPGNPFIKMVKIQVTGEATFDWMEAKYHRNYSQKCGQQSTFDESCFHGTSVRQVQYNVKLVAVRQKKGAIIIIKTNIPDYNNNLKRFPKNV